MTLTLTMTLTLYDLTWLKASLAKPSLVNTEWGLAGLGLTVSLVG